MELSFVILSWNSEKYIENCLSSCYRKCVIEGISSEILVVDNGSTDKTRGIVRDLKNSCCPNIELIELPENRGTTYPRNIALKRAIGESVCVLDSDTEFGKGNIRDVLHRLEDESIGMVVPRLILPTGEIQNSVKKFPTFLQKIKKLLKIFFKIKITDSDFYEQFPFHTETIVESAISACWFFNKKLIDICGYLDENIFYAPEDLDYCRVLSENNLHIIYFPSLEILHHTQQLSHSKPLTRVSLSHFFGLIYYFRKHGGWLAR
jgi:GT2 family glycosyltransferase